MLLASLLSGLTLVRPAEPKLPAPPDELLAIARDAAEGDREAIQTLITAVGGPILRTVRKMMGSAHPDVDDVTQDAAMALLEALPRFRGDCSVQHFAHRVAVLTAMGARRRQRSRSRFTDRDAELEALPEVSRESPLTELLGRRRRQIVRELLDDLPEPTAEALALHFMVGYTVDEIAVAASVPANTVWSRLRLGKDALRKRLATDGRLADLAEREP